MPSVDLQSDCWVDVFDADCFMGRRRRIAGPKKLRQLRAKSLIVGPKATLVLSIFRGNKKSVIRLSPKRVVPDLAKAIGAHDAILREVIVESIE
jgi:hypothetical protein